MHSIKHANEYFSSKQKCPHPLYDVFNMHRLRIFFFIPLMPVPPEVTSASRVYGYFGRPAVIICHVHTLVPFQLSWQRDGIDLGPSVTHPWVAIVIYEYSGWNSLILCYRNKLSQSQVGWLTVRISYVMFILSSLRTQVRFSMWQTHVPPDRQSAEVEYVVESPQRDDEGRYTCIATNSAGSTSSTVFLDMKGIAVSPLAKTQG